MKILVLAILVLSFAGCKKQEVSATAASTDNIDNYADTIEASINSVSGASDDANNETVIAQSSPHFFERLLDQVFISSAYAAACTRSLTNSGSGVCNRNVNCEAGAYVWSGTAQLTFSNGNSCALGVMGETFTRTINFTRSGPRGSLQTTSANRSPYTGPTIGGGVEVTKVDNGVAVDVNILGQHKILTRTNGSVIFDMSFETPTPLQLNKLARNGRIISSGVLDVYHNRAQFKAEHTISNLTYSSSCCYPVSGSISTTFTGSLSGVGSVTFNGCGNYTAIYNGQSKTFSMANCE